MHPSQVVANAALSTHRWRTLRASALFRGALATLACVLVAPQASAEGTWPTHVVRLVTPFSAGGPGDDFARMTSDALVRALGQPVIVDNKAGAGGIIGADAVAKSAADGYTLLAGANGAILNSLIRPKMPYAADSLVPVTGISASPSLIVVAPDVTAKSLKELQALGKREKDGLLFATTGIGSTSHFSGEMIKTALGIPLAFVPYKSGGESMQALIGGQVKVLSDVPTAALVGLVKAGKIRALAVASDHRLAALPDVPTTAEAGFPSIRMTHWLGLFAPKGTPPAILDRVNAAVQAWVVTEPVRKEFAARNAEPMTGDRPAFTSFIVGEQRRLGKIATELHIVVE
jgi:tripartite-type tricarboxylate transporter receptor subunit TctC